MNTNKKRLSVDSVAVRNMNCSNYVYLHKRMYAFISGSTYFICLHSSLDDSTMIPVTKVAYDDFVSYEMKFSAMVNLFAALCMKAGELPF